MFRRDLLWDAEGCSLFNCGWRLQDVKRFSLGEDEAIHLPYSGSHAYGAALFEYS